MPVLLFESEAIIQNFIVSTHNTNFDLSDLLIAHTANSSGCESTITFDKRASKFKYLELLK
jgi:predicted nucleic-acid-binding protein